MSAAGTFEEHAARHNLRGTRLGCVLIAALMPAGISLDWILYPDRVGEFLALRVLGSLAALACLWATYTPLGKRLASWLGALVALVTAGTIEFMIVRLGGYASPYYAGLNLVILAVGLIFTWQGWQIAAVCGGVIATWLIPALFANTAIELGPFFNNLYFLVLTAVIAIAATVARYALVRREFQATLHLSETTAELRQALDRLRQLDEVKTRFFTNISHELRTPLTLVLAPLESLLGRGELAARIKAELALMHRNGLRLLKHINDLLDLSRLDASKEKLALQETDAPAFLRELLASCSGLADKRGIELQLRVTDAVPPFPLDRQKVEQIFLNLVANALRFAGDGSAPRPRVTVRCGSRDGRFHFAVEDTGPGIAASQRARIFDRFQDVGSPLVAEHGGTGLGLALVKEMTELHLGTVSLASVEGEGSTFTVELPMRAEAYPSERLCRRRQNMPVENERRHGGDAAKHREALFESFTPPRGMALTDCAKAAGHRTLLDAAQAPGDHDDSGRPLVLAVDDNPDMLDYLVALLREDYRVIGACDGEQAFRLALQNAPDLVLSDLMMPRRTGDELLRDLRAEAKTRRTPVILLTSKAEAESRVLGLETGADDYVAKPFDAQELRARIRSLLRRRELEQLLEAQNERLKSINFDLVLAQKQVFLQSIQALACVVEANDRYTHGHSRRVAALSRELARDLGFTAEEYETIHVAAVLHDIGKIGVPEHILNKPDRLDDEERAVVAQHPLVGDRILESVQAFADVRVIIRHHHERFDGKGYPDGLAGAQIPRGARVVAVSDVYDAMTSDRSYRKGLSHRVAIQEIAAYAGTQLDPQMVAAFIRLYGENPPALPFIPSAFEEHERAPVRVRA